MANTTPTTRHSLILRIRDRQNAEAWQEFVGIYEPLVYQLGRRKGLQDADACELVQRVMLAVAGAVDRFQPDPERARFRTWLFRIAHNEICKQFSTKNLTHGSGDSRVQALLEQSPSPDNTEKQIAIEYRRSAFRWAAQRIEQEVKPNTWSAFWRTAVEGQPVESVAGELDMTSGAVYIARCRIMAKLRVEVQEYENEIQESGSHHEVQ